MPEQVLVVVAIKGVGLHLGNKGSEGAGRGQNEKRELQSEADWAGVVSCSGP